MKPVIIALLLTALSGCYQPQYSYQPMKLMDCDRGDKEAVYAEYVHWSNILYQTRRTRTMNCWNQIVPDYAWYCFDLDVYHDQVEAHVKRLKNRYEAMCPGKGDWYGSN